MGRALAGVFPELDIPVRQIEEMFPAIVVLQTKVDLHEGTPFRPLGLADKVEAGLIWGAVGFECVAIDTGAHNVFPSGRPSAISRDNVIEVQVFAVKFLSAILTSIAVSLENIVPGKLHFLLRQTIKEDEQDDARDSDSEGDGMDALRMGLLLRKIMPLAEIERLEGAVGTVQDDVGSPLKEQGQSAFGGADIDRLP